MPSFGAFREEARLDMTCGGDQIWEALLLFLRQLKLPTHPWTKGYFFHHVRSLQQPPNNSLCHHEHSVFGLQKSRWRIMQRNILFAHEMPLSVTQSGMLLYPRLHLKQNEWSAEWKPFCPNAGISATSFEKASNLRTFFEVGFERCKKIGLGHKMVKINE